MPECNTTSGESGSTISSDAGVEVELQKTSEGNEKSLLDLYSGCGAMSTGLCLGAESAGVKLVTVCFHFYLFCCHLYKT